MPITYDIKKDYLYREGKKEGRKEGMEKGIKKEKLQEAKERKEQIIKMLQSGMLTVEQIAEFTNTSVEQVKKIQSTLRK